MDTPSQTPTFNLKAVLKETGLKPDTLRAWERRYGLPMPERSSGGHRLYSQRDIAIIKWLTARQQEGMSISRAVELWRGLVAEGQDPLRLIDFAAPEAGKVAISLTEGHALVELRQAWISACLAYDERRAEQVVAQAFALYPVEVVCVELLQKGLAELGEGWYRGEVSVQQEHFASELAIRRLESLMVGSASPTRPERIVVGCPPLEEHTFSPLLLALFLRRRGWDVLYLGANVPAARLEDAIETAKPRLVILSAQQLHTAASLVEMARPLQEHGIPLAFGGLVFNLLPGLRDRIPGHFLGERLDQAPHAAEQILVSSPRKPPFEAPSTAYQQALNHYRDRQGLVEAQLWHLLEDAGIDYNYMTSANTHFALNIRAALTLGDMDLVGVDIEWVEGLLSHHHLPVELLRRYLRAYLQAARKHLDERGALLVDWLERVTEQAPRS